MAWRNVWRNRRRTGITVAAMAFALGLMIPYSGLMAGYIRDMERNLVDLEVGDVQVFASGYRDDPDLSRLIDDTHWTLSLEAGGFEVSERLLAWGLVAARESSAGVSFRGIDPASDADVSGINEHLDEGAWLSADHPKEVVIGRTLARMLGASVGDELVVVSQGADGAGAYDLFHVRGILGPVSEATDRTGVFLLADTFRELFVVPQGVHQLIVRRPPGLELDAAATEVRALAGPLDVQTWRELLPILANLLDTAAGAIYILFVIIYLAVAMLILNAMLMAVFERIREIGVLKALGVGPGAIFALMGVEAALQTGLAVVAGLALGLPVLLYLASEGIEMLAFSGTTVMGMSMQPIWHAVASPSSVGGPIAILVAMVAIAAFFPALKAARIDPVDAIHHN